VSLIRVGFVAVPPGPKPGFDHADVWLDGSGSRMYVAHTGADRVDVLDCRARTFLRSLDRLPGVAGVLVDQEHDLLFTSDRAAARLSLFRCSDEALLGRVAVGEAPNGLAYDRGRRRLYAFNVAKPYLATVVDVDPPRTVAEIPLPGRPRWALYDVERERVYANIQDPPLLLVFDAERYAMVDVFPVSSPGPHGLGIDGGRLFCAADGGALVVLDRDDGAAIASLDLLGAPDVVMHDPESRRLYVAIGDPGVVCSFDGMRLEHLETVDTEPGAHTIGWDPESRSLYVFCPRSCGAMVFEDRS
jgi:DNA-binding beta-propeller fold protein YncE